MPMRRERFANRAAADFRSGELTGAAEAPAGTKRASAEAAAEQFNQHDGDEQNRRQGDRRDCGYSPAQRAAGFEPFDDPVERFCAMRYSHAGHVAHDDPEINMPGAGLVRTSVVSAHWAKRGQYPIFQKNILRT
jgi:hypothetical protein